MNYRAAFLGAAMFALSACAQAEIFTFNFTGTVTYSDGTLAGVAEGTPINGQFSYDVHTWADKDPHYPEYAYYGFGRESYLRLQLGSNTLLAGASNEAPSNLSASVYNNTRSNAEDMFIISAYDARLNGATSTDSNLGFQLASQYGSTGALSSTALPRNFNLAAFDAGETLNYGWFMQYSRPDQLVMYYRIDSITNAIPEPQTWGMLVMGLGIVVFLARRKKAVKHA